MSNQTQFKSWEWFSYYKILNVPPHPAQSSSVASHSYLYQQDPQGKHPTHPQTSNPSGNFRLGHHHHLVRRTKENKFAELCKTDRDTTWSENNSITTRRTRAERVGEGELFPVLWILDQRRTFGANSVLAGIEFPGALFVPFPDEWFGYRRK